MLFSGSRLAKCVFTVALAAGVGPANTAIAASDATGYTMDDGFRAAIAEARQSLSAGDYAGALQRAQTLTASADQPVEKYSAGEVMLQAAAAQGNLRSQRIALSAILDSGVAGSKEAGRLRAMAGTLSAMLGDRKDAIAQVRYANEQGVSTIPSQLALADASFQRNDAAGGLKALDEAFALQKAGGKPIDAGWYDRAIALGYKAGRFDLVAAWTQAKLAAYPSAPNWRSGIVNYIAGAATPADQSLDLYRLMAATDAIASERDWLAYSSAASAKGTAAEAKVALDSGVTAGDVDATANAKTIAVLKPKAAKALADLPALAAKAKSGSTGAPALTAANAQFAAAKYPEAAEDYRLALSKGGVDADEARTRLGVALARSGDLAGGKAMLAGVTTGAWAPVAGFWTVWIDGKLSRNPA